MAKLEARHRWGHVEIEPSRRSERKVHSKVFFRGSALSCFSQLRCSHPLIPGHQAFEGPKPRFRNARGSHAGARAQSEALRQNLLGSEAPTWHASRYAVAVASLARPPTEPAYRRRKSEASAFAPCGAAIVTDWSRSPARLLAATRRAPRAALRRMRRGRNSKSGAPAPRGFESGTRF